jgi:hypothetical protein
MNKLLNKKTMVKAAGVGVAATAFVPGAAEAHCGHGMYGQIYWNIVNQSEFDFGCYGKGDMPADMCVWSSEGECLAGRSYYNCYTPC